MGTELKRGDLSSSKSRISAATCYSQKLPERAKALGSGRQWISRTGFLGIVFHSCSILLSGCARRNFCIRRSLG